MKKQLFAGKFEIQGEISKGQTGTIYYGYDLGLRQEVAIKVYHSHINGRLIRGKTFIEKSKPLLLIDHPNLIKIFKVEEEDDTPVVFMEFFDAPSLQKMIHDKGPMPVQDMLMLAREITEVLVHTHFQGIVHGTLHPGHVLVGPQGQIKVMDLGLSWILMDILSDCDVELLRPLPYLLPEIAKGELLNVSSDLYCLGFMMYEMLTGTVPYAGLPKTSMMGKLAFDQSDPVFDFPDSVPEAVSDLIRHMTHNKSQQRLQDSTHVLTIINQQLTKLPLSEESVFLPPLAHQPQAPSPKEENETKETSSTASAPSTTPELTFTRTHPYERPQTSANYGSVKSTKTLSKIGIALALILLAGMAGTLGFWYHDFLESHIPILQRQSDTPPQGTSLPQTMPVESEISNAPGQDSLNIQEPLLETIETVDRPKNDPQPLSIPEETAIDSVSGPTPPSRKFDLKSNQLKITEPPPAIETEQGKAPVPTTPQPQSNPSPAPAKEQPVEKTPGVSGIAPLPTTKATKKAPVQKSNSQKPKARKGKQVQSFVPVKKQPGSNPSPAPVKQQPSKITPAVPEIAPLPTTKATKKGPLKSPASLQPTKEAIPIKTESTQPATSLEEMNRDPSDEKIEELLQSLDAPTADLSSITEP
ncbi:MAG: protein kinase [Nitrospirota bacterium]|nr:protein kinase [Nitrospirota bacterium]